ncbi:hypothetical protein Tco_0195850 [Tanacetum coccineum]
MTKLKLQLSVHPLPSLEKLTGITINKPSSAPARGNKSSSVSKTNSAPAETRNLNRINSLRRRIKTRNPQHVTKNCDTCGSNVHTTFDHNDIEWFRKREALQAKKVEYFKASKTESSSALRSKTLTKRKREALQAKKVEYFKASKTESSSALRSKTLTKRYLNGTPSLGIQYSKRSGLDLKGYRDYDYAECNMDSKSTSNACQLLEGKLVC